MRPPGDFATRQDHVKSRDVYNAILSSYPDEDFGLVREAAETALKQLDQIQQPAQYAIVDQEPSGSHRFRDTGPQCGTPMLNSAGGTVTEN